METSWAVPRASDPSPVGIVQVRQFFKLHDFSLELLRQMLTRHFGKIISRWENPRRLSDQNRHKKPEVEGSNYSAAGIQSNQ